MKPSDRYETYIIGGIAILSVSLAFLPSSLLSRIGDPVGFRFIGWFVLTALCGAAIAEILELRNKWLRLLAVPPAAVLAYVGWYILKRLWAGLWADLKQIRDLLQGKNAGGDAPDWFVLLLFLLILYFWMRVSEYKEKAEQCKIQLENACEALNKQQQPAQQISEAQAGPAGTPKEPLPSRCPHCGAQL